VVASRYHQHVPRPEIVGARSGPPWSAGDARELSAAVLRSLSSRLEPHALVPDGATSAVLVPLICRPSGVVVVLTRRAATLVREPGTVAFPGGRREPGEHPLDTALREAEEEIGLGRDDVEILGALPAVERRRDGERVAVYVGLVEGAATLAPNAEEVDVVLEAPLVRLYEEGVAWEESWGGPGDERPVRFFASGQFLGNDLVWGLSAAILWELLLRFDPPR